MFRGWRQLARLPSPGSVVRVRVVAFSYEANRIYGRMQGMRGGGSKLWSVHCQMVVACIGEESAGERGEGEGRTLRWHKRPSLSGGG